MPDTDLQSLKRSLSTIGCGWETGKRKCRPHLILQPELKGQVPDCHYWLAVAGSTYYFDENGVFVGVEGGDPPYYHGRTKPPKLPSGKLIHPKHRPDLFKHPKPD